MFGYNAGMGKRVWDWQAIQQYHDEGHGFVECQRRFGFSHTAWVKAIKRGELIARFRKSGGKVLDPSDRRRIYDWTAVQAYYDDGHSYPECRAKFGFCAAAWTRAVRRGDLRARARAIPVAVLLATTKSRATVRRRLLLDGVLQNQCSICGLSEWQGRAIAMHIDHINGVCDDHRLENLRMLCPNCHSQTPTYGGRNVKRRPRRLHEAGGTV
jgi:5-methylcytosine-specific restriction endonuclease McrA